MEVMFNNETMQMCMHVLIIFRVVRAVIPCRFFFTIQGPTVATLVSLWIFVEIRVLLWWCLVRGGSWVLVDYLIWVLLVYKPFNVFLCSCVLIFAYSSIAWFSMRNEVGSM